jgi:hypothetical protein
LISLPPLGRSTDAFGAVMPELIQDSAMYRFPGSDLTELRGHVGILEEFEQQFFRHIRSAEERDTSRETRVGAPLVEEPGHKPSD